MTPEVFQAFAAVMPEPLLLVHADGRILAANRPAAPALGTEYQMLAGQFLADLVATPSDRLRQYLLACSGNGQMLPGAIHLRADGGGHARCACEGAVVRAATAEARAVILLRLKPGPAASSHFRGLNARLDQLSREVGVRRKTEQALRESEQHFRLLSANSPVGIFRTDADGHCTYTNTRCQEMGGFTFEQSLGNGWADFVHPDDRARVFTAWAARAAGQVPFAIDYRFRTPSSVVRWVHAQASPITSDSGQVVGHVGTIEDVTVRRRNEALIAGQKRVLELIAQGEPLNVILEELTRSIATQASEGTLPSVLLLDKDGVHLRHGAAPTLPDAYNRAIDGVAIGPAVGSCGSAAYRRQPVMATDIATDPLWTDYRDLALGHGLRACWSTPILAADGQVLGTFAMYYTRGGAPRPEDQALISIVTRTAAIAIERKRAEEDLQNQQQWLEAVLNLMPTPLLLIEPGTARVTFANRAADEMAGGEFPRGAPAADYHTAYRYTDADGQPIPNDRLPGVRVAGGERVDGVQMDWHTLGGKRALILFGDTIPPIHGHPASGVVMFQDISSIKQIEADLQRANRLKDEFLATVSHELRTPLNAMLGWARMLRTGQLDEATTTRALKTIERSAKAQAQLIEDLLDVSRIISGKLRLDIQVLEPVAPIELAIDALRAAAEAKGVDVRVAIDPSAGLVAGDPDRLQQVVWNLLSNAIKFTPADGRVEVRLERRRSEVTVTVSDTGKGIRREFLPYVFDRFSQADGTITRAAGGLGLGLAIVRHLVELHGGTVSVSSRGEGLGATFAVTLPVANARDTQGLAAGFDGRAVSPTVDAAFTPSPSLVGLRVVAIDDEPDARELLTTVLGQCGVNVTVVGSAADALPLIDQLRPDLIISDIEMPDEDGYTLIRRLRALETAGARRVPAIALTAHARSEDRLRALTAGYDTHVAKPVEPAELVAVIARLAGRRGVSYEPAV